MYESGVGLRWGHIQSTAFGAAEFLIKDSPELLGFTKWLICIYCNNAGPSSLFSRFMQNLSLSSCEPSLHWWGNHTRLSEQPLCFQPVCHAVISSRALLFAVQSPHWCLTFRSLHSVPLKKLVRSSRSPAWLMCLLSSPDLWSPPAVFLPRRKLGHLPGVALGDIFSDISRSPVFLQVGHQVWAPDQILFK